MTNERYLFSSESVTEGHPDKVADQISDGVLDAILADDPMGRVACEVLCKDGQVVLAGEITTAADPNYEKITRETITRIGYTDSSEPFSAEAAILKSSLSLISVETTSVTLGLPSVIVPVLSITTV